MNYYQLRIFSVPSWGGKRFDIEFLAVRVKCDKWDWASGSGAIAVNLGLPVPAHAMQKWIQEDYETSKNLNFVLLNPFEAIWLKNLKKERNKFSTLRTSTFGEIGNPNHNASSGRRWINYPIVMRQAKGWRNVSVLPRAALYAIAFECRALTGAVTTHRESQLLRHLRAQRLPVRLSILLRIPAEFQNRHENGESQSAQQHHEHPADVLHAQSVRFRFFVLLVSAANFWKFVEKRNDYISTIRNMQALPPVFFHHLS